MEWRCILIRGRPLMLLFTLVCFTVFQKSICTCYNLSTPGRTYPSGDIIIENGTTLEIYCLLNTTYMNEHNVSSRNLQFLRGNKLVPSEYITTINESTVRLRMDLPGSINTFICQLNNSKDPTPVCLNQVNVSYKPIPVTNFMCFGYNFNNLTCTWTAPELYVKTNYSLTYTFKGRNSRGLYSCPEVKKRGNEYSCYWDISTTPHYRQFSSVYYFKLNITNMFGSHIQKITFMHFANVIPAPPENLEMLNKTSNSVLLKWAVKAPMDLIPCGIIHRVVYQSEFDSKDVWHVSNTSSLDKNNTPVFNLTGLQYAHVLYDIRISMRSLKALDVPLMWSKNVSLTVRTESAVPGAAPKINIGSFQIENNRTGRDIFVYWQSIPEQLKNGENFSYKVYAISDSIPDKYIEPIEVTHSYAHFVGLHLSRHKFIIYSSNEIGLSEQKSIITVPAFIDKVPEPVSFTKISYGKQLYELSWGAPEKSLHEITSYTIFYCRNDYDRPFQCKGYLEWVEVPFNETEKNITVPEDKVYQFAISANTEKESSGMIWASCTVIHNKEITKMKNVWVNEIGSNFIEVEWKLDCSDRIGSIDGFVIYYCPIKSPVQLECSVPEQNITITGDGSQSHGRVTNLKPYTTYMLTIAVKSKFSSGLPSAPLYNTTLEGAPDPPENVTITNITNTSMIVKWSPPKNKNGILRYYEVRYSSKDKTLKTKPIDDLRTEVQLTNLSSYTDFKIQVFAYTTKFSNSSDVQHVRTAISVPGVMHSPNIKFYNDSITLLSWSPPDNAGGKLDKYQLQVKTKINSYNVTTYYNTTDLQMEVASCGQDKANKVMYFSVRALNYDKERDKWYGGEWSPEIQNSCQSATRIVLIICIAVGIFCIPLLFYLLKRLWSQCKRMKDVEIKLPPGLASNIPTDVDLTMKQWNVHSVPKLSGNDDQSLHLPADSSADQELLLDKTKILDSHDRMPSGDSSGCSSGHESVTSSLASGTNLSSTSDSGTEQPKTPSSGSVSRENSLRQRRTGTDSIGWDTEIAWPKAGYIPSVPLDKPTSPQSWSSAKSPPNSNYCVLGMNNALQPASDVGPMTGYVPVPLNIPQTEQAKQNNKSTASPPYVTCDTIFNKDKVGVQQSPKKVQSPPYVTTSDVALMGRPLHVQQMQPAGGGKLVGEQSNDSNVGVTTTPTYVMAGGSISNKGRPYVKAADPDLIMGKLINIEPLHDVQDYDHQNEKEAPLLLANANLEGIEDNYVSSPREPEVTPSGYVKAQDIFNFKEDTTDNRELSSPRGINEGTESLHTNQQSPANEQMGSSYCRLGWDGNMSVEPTAVTSPVMRKTPVDLTPSKGYIPHKQFENKSLKED